MKRTTKILKKILLSGFLLILLSSSNIAFAGLCDDISDATSGWISCGEESTTFTEFEGGLQPPSEEGYDEGITKVKTVREYVVNVTNFILGFLGLIGVVMIIYGGFMYLTAAGEQDALDKGKKTITYAVVGIIIVMASFAIVNTVIQAPSGEEGKGTAEKQVLTAVDRSQRSFNMLANRVKTLAKDLVTAYQNHIEVEEQLNGVHNSVALIKLHNPKDSWSDGLKDSLVAVETQMQEIQKSLNIVADKTKSGLLRQAVFRFEQYWKSEYEEGYSSAEKAADDNGCKECDITESDCVCYDEEVGTVLSKMRDNLCRIETALMGAKPGEGDASSACDDATDKISTKLLPEEKGGGVSVTLDGHHGDDEAADFGCETSLAVSVKCMKRYSKEEFYSEANRIKNEIKGIYEQVGSLTSIGDDYFGALISLENLQGMIGGTVSAASAEGLLQDLKTSVKASDSAKAEGELKTIIATMIQLIESLKDIRFVDAVLSADVMEGSAPLIVNFSALDSYDPSEVSIGSVEDTSNLQVQWDLDGNGEYNNESVGDVICTNVTDGDANKKSSLTPYCTYKKPGSYRVGLKVRSSNVKNEATGRNYDKEIAEGRVFLTIKVSPPTTKIMLKAGEDYVRKYDANGSLLVDKDKVTFTINEAQAEEGIVFDVNESVGSYFQDQPEDYIKSIKWDFGDGVTEEGYSEGAGQKPQKGLEVAHKFAAGKYKVKVETVNIKSQKDRVIFDVVIKEIKADVKVTPGLKVKVSETVTIDASGSKTDVGKIVEYDWSCPDKDKCVEEIDKHDGEVKFTTIIKKAGETKLSLTVKNNSPEGGESDTFTVVIFAESQPPVASFRYDTPFQNKPSEVYFDGSQSYDPDISPESELVYEWSFDGEEGTDFVSADGGEVDYSVKKQAVRFLKIGTYKVSLTVYDPMEDKKKSTFDSDIEIKNILSAWWPEGQQIAAQLTSGQTEDVEVEDETKVQPDNKKLGAKVDFKVEQYNGSYAEWDFGDGEKDVTESITANQPVEMSHTYTESGKYKVNVTMFDKDDNDLAISRSVYIGGGEKPIAAPRIYVDGSEQFDFENYPAGDHKVTITRKSVVTFDAADSLNADGTGRKLVYEWQFGDGDNSTQKVLTHTYKDVDLMIGSETDEEGNIYKELMGKLIVRDKDDSSKKDEITFAIKVISAKPKLKSLTAVIEGSSVETPVDAKVEAIGAEDEDGKIIQYKWFYFDVKENDVILGQQITKTPSTKIKIGPRGTPGEEKTYRFDVEMTDDENSKIFAGKLLPETMLPTVTVINGPNDPPVASFGVDRTSVEVGDSVNFASTSKDPDGKIIEYMWDLNGDGFENDIWTDEETVEFKFVKSNKNGVKIRLKVRDNNFTETISKPVLVFVTSDAEPPVAAFTSEQVGVTKQVKFENNSSADEKNGAMIEKFTWDFDTASTLASSDSDGDGKKDNDQDSIIPEPIFTYDEYGTYKVKLTINDTEGNEDSVTNTITLKAPIAPTQTTGMPSGVTPGTTVTPGTAVTPGTTVTPGTAVTPGTIVPLDARLKSIPPTNPIDNKIHISGTGGDVEFDFSESVGNIVKYAIDKNIYFDTNGNGVNDDDDDFVSQVPIKWMTHFEKSWGKTMVRLRVYDALGNKDDVAKEIVFDDPSAPGGVSSMGVNVFAAGEVGRLMPAFGILLFTILTAIAIKVKNYGQ